METGHFGQRIKELLNERGMAPAELSRKTGISKAAVSLWLKGETKELKGDNLIKVAQLFGVNAKWLQSGEGEKLHDRAKIRAKVVENSELSYSIPKSRPDTLEEALACYTKARSMIWEASNYIDILTPYMTYKILGEHFLKRVVDSGYKITLSGGFEGTYEKGVRIRRETDDKDAPPRASGIIRLPQQKRGKTAFDFDLYLFSAPPLSDFDLSTGFNKNFLIIPMILRSGEDIDYAFLPLDWFIEVVDVQVNSDRELRENTSELSGSVLVQGDDENTPTVFLETLSGDNQIRRIDNDYTLKTITGVRNINNYINRFDFDGLITDAMRENRPKGKPFRKN